MMSNLNIRRYEDGDKHKIIELMALGGDPISENYWSWIWADKSCDPPKIWVVEDNGKIVCNLTVIPIRIKINGEIKKGGIAVDAMTHPSYRGRGLYTMMVNRCMEDCKGEMHILFGFSRRKEVLSIYKKLGLLLSSLTPLIIKMTNSNSQPEISKPINEFEIIKTSSFDKRVNLFWQLISKNHDIIVARDMNYLNWRYDNKPNVEYVIYYAEKDEKILGYIVLKTYIERENLKKVHIVDMLAFPSPPGIIEGLISQAILFYREIEADEISCWVSPNTVYHEILKEIGFVPTSTDYFLDIFTWSSTLSSTYIKNLNNWFITMGDLIDVF